MELSGRNDWTAKGILRPKFCFFIPVFLDMPVQISDEKTYGTSLKQTNE